MNKQEIFEKIIEFLKNEGAKRISVFGSYVRCRHRCCLGDSKKDIPVLKKKLMDIKTE
jgi:predicted nucleotidyltransferase